MSYVNFSSYEIGECWYDSSILQCAQITRIFFFFFFCINEICQNATCQLLLNFCPHKTEQYFEFQSNGGSHPQFTCESK